LFQVDVVPTSENQSRTGAENENFEQETEITRAPTKERDLAPSSKETGIESLIPIHSENNNNVIKEIPRTFCYYLVLKTVKFSKKPENGIWQIM
jgi:hypothetical protein